MPACAHSHDGRCLRVGRAHRQTQERCRQEAQGPGKISAEALIGLQLHHVDPYRLNDFPAADRCSQGHDRGTQQHQPDRNHEISRGISLRQSDAQQENPDELLAVLGSMHEGHRSRTGDLAVAEEGCRALPLNVLEQRADQFHDKEPQETTQERWKEPSHTAP